MGIEAPHAYNLMFRAMTPDLKQYASKLKNNKKTHA